MRYFVGLDVGLHQTSICIIDQEGRTAHEASVDTDPGPISAFLDSFGLSYGRVGLEACSLAEWLYPELAKMGLPMVCIEARHAHGILKANLNKTDRNDARGIASMMRIGIFRVVHVKTQESQLLRTLVTMRRVLQIKAIDIENAVGGILRSFGFKLRRVKAEHFEIQVRALLGNTTELTSLIEPLLIVRATLRAQFQRLDEEVRKATESDPVCRRLMTAPGVGSIVAATYRCAIDVPERFGRSRTIGAHLGLTPRTRQSGTMESRGRISRWGDQDARAALFNAACSILNPRTRNSPLREWGLRIAARRGRMKATVAVARRLAVILHRMWVDETDYRPGATIA